MDKLKFPKTLKEFREQFSEEAACFQYLGQSRWPDGFVCPRCSGRESWIKARRYVYECCECGLQTSVTAGTILHRTHFSLREWFWAAYLVATHTPGMSGTQLQRQMGCSYKTAWYLLHRLRRSMVNESRSLLCGRVEADEVIIGGPVRGKTGRGVTKDEKNTLVFGAVEVIVYTDKHGGCMEKAGRLRLAVTQRADAVSIRNFLTALVQPGSEIYTDGWKGYSKTALADYRHVLQPPEIHALHIHRGFGQGAKCDSVERLPPTSGSRGIISPVTMQYDLTQSAKTRRRSAASRNQNPLGPIIAQRRRERGEKILPKMQTSPTLHCNGKRRKLISDQHSPFGDPDWQRQLVLCAFASSRPCIELLQPYCMDTAQSKRAGARCLLSQVQPDPSQI